MPKTRRAQPQTAPRPGTRAKKDAKSLAREDEKENIGSQPTASRQHRRSRVLGATTTLGVSSTASKAVPKGVKKPKPSQVKKEKLPLQDITSQFLPAPESANRGAGSEGGERILPLHDLSYSITTIPNTSRRPNLLLSPLPPSSPPPDLVLPSVEPFEGNTDDRPDDQPDNPFSDNTENHRQTSSSSDPFGFAALERKLKEERRFVTRAVDTYEDDDIYEELGEILVADTSSPRHVSRIKKSVAYLEGERLSPEIENPDEAVDEILVPLAHPHFSTPPTPHKDKNIHRRLSRGDPDIFSPCSSSLESSPSPTKTSAIKRRRDFLYGQDPLEEFNTTVDEGGCANAVADDPPSKRPCQVSRSQDEGDHNTIKWNLRPRHPPAAEKTKAAPKPPKDTSAAKPSKKAKPNSSKKVPTFNDDNDWEEKWQQEREDRIEFFNRLADYSVEKENVYII